MKKAISFLLAFLLFVAGVAMAQDARSSAGVDWIYLVKTEPSDPAREAEFNTWYDDIDIPDVLAVPSFRRARRAIGQEVPEYPDVRLKEGDGAYMALYDIATSDIDKSIIDLYVAARKMNALGRSTDALRVVEANYYYRLGGHALRTASVGTDRYFLIQKIICCSGDPDVAKYQEWFANQLIPALGDTDSVVGVNLYQLYRVMEELAVGEDENPHLLTVFEIETESAGLALSELQGVLQGFQVSGSPGYLREVRDSILYMQMSDVKSD